MDESESRFRDQLLNLRGPDNVKPQGPAWKTMTVLPRNKVEGALKIRNAIEIVIVWSVDNGDRAHRTGGYIIALTASSKRRIFLLFFEENSRFYDPLFEPMES